VHEDDRQRQPEPGAEDEAAERLAEGEDGRVGENEAERWSVALGGLDERGRDVQTCGMLRSLAICH